MKNIKINLTQFYLILFVLFFAIDANATWNNNLAAEGKPEVIIIHDKNVPRAEKEALIILPGLGDKRKGRRHQRKYFSQTEYDLFIPNYITRKSFDRTVGNFTQFFAVQKLGEYRKVHVFSYVLGTWVLNTFINEHGQQNIATIVYDRSPLQERAPQVAVDKIPLITRIFAGKIIKQFTKVPYPPIEQNDIRIGIIVENKATPLIRFFKKKTKSYGPINWKNLDFNQAHDDMIFTRLNHDQMYYSFDEIGNDILYFIKNGTFTKEARRVCFDWDVFEKYKG